MKIFTFCCTLLAAAFGFVLAGCECPRCCPTHGVHHDNGCCSVVCKCGCENCGKGCCEKPCCDKCTCAGCCVDK